MYFFTRYHQYQEVQFERFGVHEIGCNLGSQRFRKGQSQSYGRCGHRQGRQNYLTRISRKVRPSSRRDKCSGELHNFTKRCNDICYIGAVLSLRENSSLHGSDHTKRYFQSGHRYTGCKSFSFRQGCLSITAAWHSGRYRYIKTRMQPTD